MLLEVGLLTTTIYSISVNLQTYTSIHHTQCIMDVREKTFLILGRFRLVFLEKTQIGIGMSGSVRKNRVWFGYYSYILLM